MKKVNRRNLILPVFPNSFCTPFSGGKRLLKFSCDRNINGLIFGNNVTLLAYKTSSTF